MPKLHTINSLIKEKGTELIIAFTCLAGIFTPIRLSIGYIFISLALTVFTFYRSKELLNYYRLYARESIVIAAFILIIFYSTIFGVDHLASIKKVSSSIILILFAIPLYSFIRSIDKVIPVLLAIIFGQFIVALHTVAEGAFPHLIPELSQGPVTESGRIALVFFISLGLVQYLTRETPKEAFSLSYYFWLISILGSCCLTLLGFAPALGLSWPAISALLIACLMLFVSGFKHCKKSVLAGDINQAVFWFVTIIALPVIVSALLINLKRGPWLGVSVGLFIFLWRFNPRLNLFNIIIGLILSLGIAPIRDRIYSSSQHFFIRGGRSEMWDLGYELLMRFPLGIGYNNSKVISNYTYNIPSYLNHFHNNLINIGVELGWIGLIVFVIWMATYLWQGLLKTNLSKDGALSYSLACGILAWQTAGLVEYNFGDSAVFLVAVVLMGMLTHRPQTT